MATRTKAKAPKRARRKAPPAPLHVELVVDKSSSIAYYGLTDAVIDGVNEYVKGLVGQESVVLSATQFADGPERTFEGLAPEDVPVLTRETYVPDGNTALYDTVGDVIERMDELEEGARRLVVVVTDGEDTCSVRRGASSVAALVRVREAEGCWTFVYLGLGRTEAEVVATARAMGYAAENAMFVAARSVGATTAAYANLAGATSSLASSARATTKTFYGDAGQDAKLYNKGG